MGADHPGMVHKETKALAAHGLSIDLLRTTPETWWVSMLLDRDLTYKLLLAPLKQIAT